MTGENDKEVALSAFGGVRYCCEEKKQRESACTDKNAKKQGRKGGNHKNRFKANGLCMKKRITGRMIAGKTLTMLERGQNGTNQNAKTKKQTLKN